MSLRNVLLGLKLARRDVPDKVWMWLADHMPRPLVYWCAIRLGVNAVSGEHSDDEVPGVTFMDALERWEVEQAPYEQQRDS